MYCTGKDIFGRDVVEAYGAIHVPTQPGKHTRYARMFKPISSSLLTKFFGWLAGKNAEYVDAPRLIAKAEGREVTRVQSGGLVKVTFQVTLRRFEELGYITKSTSST